MRPKSTVPTLRELALSVIDNAALEIQKSDPRISLPQALAKAVQTDDEARSAWRVFQLPGAALPLAEALAALSGKTAPMPASSMRAQIIAKRAQVAKEGGSGGSGPRGSTTESPVTSGRKTPADKLPAQPTGRKVSAPKDPAAMLLAAMHEQAAAAFPDLSPAQAFVQFMSTEAGAELHRQWQAAHAAQVARGAK